LFLNNKFLGNKLYGYTVFYEADQICFITIHEMTINGNQIQYDAFKPEKNGFWGPKFQVTIRFFKFSNCYFRVFHAAISKTVLLVEEATSMEV
jgi:hypothetical protein